MSSKDESLIRPSVCGGGAGKRQHRTFGASRTLLGPLRTAFLQGHGC